MRSALQQHAATLPAAIAVAFATGALVLLHLSALTMRLPSGVAELCWLAGWTLAVWAAISSAVAGAQLWRHRRADAASTASTWSLGLLAAAVALLASAAMLHPFAGTGTGLG